MNLKQLADHLGLSQTTVSRALNGFPEVGEATRLRVVEAAQEFQYQPNSSARKLATGRAGAIGIVLAPDRDLLHDPIFMDFLAGLATRGAEAETDVLVSATTGDEAATYHRLAKVRSVDAVIVSTPSLDDPRITLLHQLKMPMVVHGRSQTDVPFSYVDIDNEAAFNKAATHLIELGHRHIGLINGDKSYTFAEHRSRGWRAAMTGHGLPAPEEYDLSSPMTEEGGYRMARRLLDSGLKPTALLCSSIFVALGAMRAARDLSLTIGKELSIIAHDDGINAIRPETLSLPLTTTFSSIQQAGRRVADIAMEMVANPGAELVHEIWPVDLVPRASTAPPA